LSGFHYRVFTVSQCVEGVKITDVSGELPVSFMVEMKTRKRK